ncbi:hypothetical protein [Streptomyces sp. NPDC059919]|uniref:hypothetical protein n=1 Tax=Streptomyces sp. NPDC059919 TaxID=3347004 RepID=UPI003651371A
MTHHRERSTTSLQKTGRMTCRSFPDKRQVLFDRGTGTGPLVEGIASAPPAAGPLDTVAGALDVLGRRWSGGCVPFPVDCR